MNRALLELKLKKERLLAESAARRSDLARHARGLEPVFRAADRVRDGVSWLRRHPALPVAVLAALVVARPRGIVRWARRGIVAWQVLRRANRWLLESRR